MKVIGINGAARKNWNTDTLVKTALEGAASAGAETELIELYAEPIKGCLECFACKRKGIDTGGLCAIRDNLRPILEKALSADAIVMGSPNFFGYPSGMLRSFIERLLYPLTSYQVENGQIKRKLGKRIIPAGIIFTMNSSEDYYNSNGYNISLGTTRNTLEFILGYAEQYNSYNTLQFKDYSKMEANLFDPEEKMQQHETQFPIDKQQCFEMGKRLVNKALELNKE